MPQLKDYLNDINFDKVNIMDDENLGEENERAYNPFIINRCLGSFMDTVLFANEMNMRSHATKKMQYDFYINSVRKRKRFSKWVKSVKPDNLAMVKEYYGYSDAKALQVLDMLSDEAIENIKQKLEKGGRRSTYAKR